MGQVGGPPRSGSLSIIQRERDAWVAHNFPNDRIEDSFMGMVEEMGELAHHLLKSRQGIRGGDIDHRAEIMDACADLVIFELGIASHLAFDLGHIVSTTWDQVKQRDWIKFPKDGVTT